MATVIGILLGILITYLFLNGKHATLMAEHRLLSDSNTTLKTELAQERHLLADAISTRNELDKRLTELSTDHRHLQQRFNDISLSQEEDEKRFEQLAAKILDQKTKDFDIAHKAGIKEILEPLKEKIKHFEDKVDHTHKDTIKQHSELKHQISGLTDLNKKMSQDAVNLTNALKSDSKTQGNWGELILDSILEKSGLEKGREYHVQQSFNQEGRQLRPDVIIDLPNQKKLIIDSKVSLTAYEQLVNAHTEDEQAVALKAHLISLRKHIDGLSSKNYHSIYQIESPDFVLMFVPIESAFSVAIKSKPGIYQYAFDQNIVIVTPSTLLVALKTVESLWQNEKQQRNAVEIATEAGKMYDKFASLVVDLQKLGNQMDTAKNTFDNSMKKLKTGQGNLVGRVEKLKKLGAKAHKSLKN